MTKQACKNVITIGLLVLMGTLLLAAPALGQTEPYSHGNCCNNSDNDDDDDDETSPPTSSAELPSFPTPGNTPPPEVLGGQIPGAVPRPETQPEVVIPANVPNQQPGILPFTGADLLLYGMTGAAAIGTGMTMVRIGRRSKPDDDA